MWLLRRGNPDLEKEMNVLVTTEDGDSCGDAEDAWMVILGAGAAWPWFLGILLKVGNGSIVKKVLHLHQNSGYNHFNWNPALLCGCLLIFQRSLNPFSPPEIMILFSHKPPCNKHCGPSNKKKPCLAGWILRLGMGAYRQETLQGILLSYLNVNF